MKLLGELLGGERAGKLLRPLLEGGSRRRGGLRARGGGDQGVIVRWGFMLGCWRVGG